MPLWKLAAHVAIRIRVDSHERAELRVNAVTATAGRE